MGSSSSHVDSHNDNSGKGNDIGSNNSIGGTVNIGRRAQPNCQPGANSKTAAPCITIANATNSPIRLYYKPGPMENQDLIDGNELKEGESILISARSLYKTPLSQNLYVTGFKVKSDKTHCCPEESPMCGLKNLHAEFNDGNPKSYIITDKKEVKFTRNGEIWVDEEGMDHTPKK